MDDHLTGILSNIGMISFVALSAYLLLLTGEISFGQQAFFAIGAYTAGIVTAMWQLPFWFGLGAGAAAGRRRRLVRGIADVAAARIAICHRHAGVCGSRADPVRTVPLSGGAGRRAGGAERHRGFPQYPLYLRARRQRDAVHADHLRIAPG